MTVGVSFEEGLLVGHVRQTILQSRDARHSSLHDDMPPNFNIANHCIFAGTLDNAVSEEDEC